MIEQVSGQSESSDRVFTSRRIVLPAGVIDGGILVRDGTITAILGPDDRPDSAVIRDFGDAVIMPGLVDTHVHINEPGRTEWEGFETATRAAASGGVTTLVDMPLNSTPVTTTPEALDKKIQAARGVIRVDCGFYGGLVPGSLSQLEALIRRGVLGIKAFLIESGLDEFEPVGTSDLEAGLKILAGFGVPLLAHAERSPTDHRPVPGPVSSCTSYARTRPASWEVTAVEELIDLAARHGSPVHIVHVASAMVLARLRQARQDGVSITAETCPHYLFFDSDSIPDGNTLYKCAPPIRDRSNAKALLNALLDGDLDFVASDHSPCPIELKNIEDENFLSAWGGISSLGLTLSVLWTVLRSGTPSEHTPDSRASDHDHPASDKCLILLSRWLSTRPAELVGLSGRKGAIVPGADADLVVWNPEEILTVGPHLLHMRHKDTPYEGCTLAGRIETTMLRGDVVFDHGIFPSESRGEVLLRNPGIV